MKMMLLWLKVSGDIPLFLIKMKQLSKIKASVDKKYQLLRELCIKVVKRSPVNVHVEGLEKIPKEDGFAIVSNHQGNLDPILMVSAIDRSLTAVAKKEVEKMPIIKDVAVFLDVVTIDRKNIRSAVRSMKQITNMLNNKRNLVIFPEGTRSLSLKMNEFKPGSLKPVVDAKCPIVITTIINSFYMFEKKGKNKDVYLIISEVMNYEQYKDMSSIELINYIQQVIEKDIKNYTK